MLLQKKGAVHVIIHKQSTAADILRAFIHALLVASFTGRSKAVHTDSRLWMDENYTVLIAKVLWILLRFSYC